jgi:hypothetical protein
MKRIAIFIVLLFGLIASPARAQSETARIVQTTKPISAELRAALDAWLAVSPPAPYIYYAVTYTQAVGIEDTYASLVALNITGPDDEWHFTEDENGESKVVWFGTVKVYADGTVEKYVPPDQVAAYKPFAPIKLAALEPFIPSLLSPLPSAGGGAYVRFPFQSAKAVKYGILGVHGAGYTSYTNSSWWAVDLVSGDGMGSGAANDSVYASTSGSVDFVCEGTDAWTVGVSGGGDSFIYAHMLENANLTMGHAFTRGSVIGTLIHGSYTDDCGWAVQQADNWHLHWGFIKSSSNSFQAEGCILSADQYWTCGTTKVKPTNYLNHYGSITTDNNGTITHGEDSGMGDAPSFFDNLVQGAGEIFAFLFTNNLPEHGSPSTFITPIINGVKIVFRIAWVLLRGNFNFVPAIAAVVLLLTTKFLMGSVYLVVGIARMIKA